MRRDNDFTLDYLYFIREAFWKLANLDIGFAATEVLNESFGKVLSNFLLGPLLSLFCEFLKRITDAT